MKLRDMERQQTPPWSSAEKRASSEMNYIYLKKGLRDMQVLEFLSLARHINIFLRGQALVQPGTPT